MICPVCNRTFKTTTDSINYTLCEEYGVCRCGYHYQFGYGAERHVFGPFAVIESYTDSPRREWWNQRKFSLLVAFWRAVTFGGGITVEVQS